MKRFFFPCIWWADEVHHWSKGRIRGKWPVLGRVYITLGLHHTERKNAMTSIIGAVLRWLLTLAGAAGATVSNDEVTQLSAALLALGTLVWSIVQKVRASKKEKKSDVG